MNPVFNVDRWAASPYRPDEPVSLQSRGGEGGEWQPDFEEELVSQSLIGSAQRRPSWLSGRRGALTDTSGGAFDLSHMWESSDNSRLGSRRSLSGEGPSYWSQSESCFDENGSMEEETRHASSEASPLEEVSICYKPHSLKSNLVEQMRAVGSPSGWWAALGAPPCPNLRVRLHHRDTLMIKVPEAIYAKMVAWGHNELIVMAERRVRTRGRVFGICTSDSASEYLCRLCCFVTALAIVHDALALLSLFAMHYTPCTWTSMSVVTVICVSSLAPYLMAIRHKFGAVYVLWCAFSTIMLIVKIKLLANVVMMVLDASRPAKPGTPPLRLWLAKGHETVMCMAEIAMTLACLVSALNLAASYVLRQVNNLEERLIRVVSVHEKGHKHLNVAPFELWAAGLYSGEKAAAATAAADEAAPPDASPDTSLLRGSDEPQPESLQSVR